MDALSKFSLDRGKREEAYREERTSAVVRCEGFGSLRWGGEERGFWDEKSSPDGCCFLFWVFTFCFFEG